MQIRTDILEIRFEEFKELISKKDNKPFMTFKSSDFIDNNEDYKYSVYKEARENLGNKFWKPNDVGTGKIKRAVVSAIKTRVIHNYQMTDNNLVDWRKKDNFTKRANSKKLEQIFFDLYKSKVKDRQAFEQLLNEGLSYQFIAYLFFIKDSNRFLPISQEQFDKIFGLIGLLDFKTRNNASWDNYNEFCNIIKQVRDFLKTKDTNATLLDAHSFLWILGWQQTENQTKPSNISSKDDIVTKLETTIQEKDEKHKIDELSKSDWIIILQNREITTEYDLSIFQALYSFENHQAYASQIGLILGHTGKTPQSSINLEIGKYAKRIAKDFDIIFTIRSNEKFKYWDLFFKGWEEGSFFMWKLKPEIVGALEDTGLTGINLIAEEIPEKETADLFEGAKKTVTINAYERNSKARKVCIDYWGTKCSVCGFDFEKVYGSIGKGFIHVHHLIPVAQIGKSYQINPINDLRPVCPNCHSMIHSQNPPLSIEKVKRLINNEI